MNGTKSGQPNKALVLLEKMMALHEAGTDLDAEITAGGLVIFGRVVSPAIDVQDKVTVDGWAAAGAAIGNGGGYGVNAAGARLQNAFDDAVVRVGQDQAGRQCRGAPDKRADTTDDVQVHGEGVSFPGYRVKDRDDFHITCRSSGYDIYVDRIRIIVWSASGFRKLGDANNKRS